MTGDRISGEVEEEEDGGEDGAEERDQQTMVDKTMASHQTSGTRVTGIKTNNARMTGFTIRVMGTPMTIIDNIKTGLQEAKVYSVTIRDLLTIRTHTVAPGIIRMKGDTDMLATSRPVSSTILRILCKLLCVSLVEVVKYHSSIFFPTQSTDKVGHGRVEQQPHVATLLLCLFQRDTMSARLHRRITGGVTMGGLPNQI